MMGQSSTETLQQCPDKPPAGLPDSVDIEHAEALPTNLPRIGLGGASLIGLSFLLLLAGLFLLGYRPYRSVQSDIISDAAEAAHRRPIVAVTTPKRQERTTELVLPAEIQAYQDTAIYPRSNGYLKRFLVDIGDRVQEGQLLAEIETPEIDAQLNQARAAVQQAQANIEKAKMDLGLGETTWNRYQTVGAGGVSQQELDEKRTQLDQAKAGLNVARANMVAAQAEVQRLEALSNFKQVNAPFAGTISTRNYDVGALLSPGGSGASRELFQIARTDILRIFAQVPQAYATLIEDGQRVKLHVSNYPGVTFEGKVTRSSGTLNPSTRTLRVQIDVANDEQLLFAGMYGQLTFHITQDRPPLLVPSSALIFDAHGLQVSVLRDGKARMKAITVGRDFGKEIEVLQGLTESDVIITNPGQRVHEGTEVQIATPAFTPAQAAQ